MDSARRLVGLSLDAPVTGTGVRVAVLDTGIDEAHPDLAGRFNVDLSRSFTTKAEIADRNGHGTHVAGIIGGTGKESNGLYRGIAPDCELVVYKIAEQKHGPEGNAAAAIEAAIDAGVDVINFSHGFVPRVGEPPWVWPEVLTLLEETFSAAADAGILCVVASGNSGPLEGSITRPGGLECVLTVSGLGPELVPLRNSSRGPFRRCDGLRPGGVTRYDRISHTDVRILRKPDLAAPGLVIAPRAARCFHTEDPDAGTEDPYYVALSGSSQATAVVTGLAALLIQLVKQKSVDLGENRVRTIHRLITHAAVPTALASPNEVGAGLPFWPNIVARLEDFMCDSLYRDQVLHNGLELI